MFKNASNAQYCYRVQKVHLGFQDLMVRLALPATKSDQSATLDQLAFLEDLALLELQVTQWSQELDYLVIFIMAFFLTTRKIVYIVFF